jgi:hypothetical protein
MTGRKWHKPFSNKLVPSKEHSNKGTLTSAFRKRVTEIDIDSDSESEAEVVEVVLPSPTATRASSPISAVGSAAPTPARMKH